MSREFRFFIYLLEHFAAYRCESAADTFDLLEKSELLDYAENMYELYHVESLENAFKDLNHRIALASRSGANLAKA